MRVRAALPRQPLTLYGELQSRDRQGNIIRVNPIEMTWRWGADRPSAEYVVQDRFGGDLERLLVTLPMGEPSEFLFMEGDAADWTPLTDLNRSMAGLDLDWADVSLSYLWWRNARIVGSERVRGRFCYIVDLRAPPDEVSRYAGVRIWVDPELALLMQVDAYDARNRPIRRMQVKSLHKLDDLWMIQNIELVNHATRERVTLRVRRIRALDDSYDAELN